MGRRIFGEGNQSAKMDIELLISNIFERQALWDKRNKFHSIRNVVHAKNTMTSSNQVLLSSEYSYFFLLVLYYEKIFLNHFSANLTDDGILPAVVIYSLFHILKFCPLKFWINAIHQQYIIIR